MLTHLFIRSSIYFGGLALSKILNVIIFILFARALQPKLFGEFVLFITFVQLTTFIADFGLTQWYQTKAHQTNKQRLLNQVLMTRLITLSISMLSITTILILTHTFSLEIIFILLATLIPEALLLLTDGFYLENKQPFIISLKNISKVGIPLGGYYLIHNHFSLQSAVFLYFLGSFITCVLFFPRIPMKLYFSFSHTVNILKKSLVYALLTLTSYTYSRGDSLIIRYTLNNVALSMYSISYRYLESLSLLPTALMHNLFPISAQKKGLTASHIKKIIFLMTVIGCVVGFFIFYNSQLLIVGLFGKSYQQAVPVMHILSLVLILFFINAPIATVVQSSSHLKQFLPFGIANTLVNIILNLIFIPLYGIVASAWIMLITESVGLIINIVFIKKRYNISA